MLDNDGFWQEWNNAWPHRMHLRSIIPRFLHACPDPFLGEVLEIGSGRGWTSQIILEMFPQVELTATDVDPLAIHMFDKLHETYGRRLHVREANALNLPFDRDSFDIVVAVNVVSKFNPYGLKKALQSALRVVRPGGLIGFSERSFVAPRRLSHKENIVAILAHEDCKIVHDAGSRRYDMWIRKSYPVPPDQFEGSVGGSVSGNHII